MIVVSDECSKEPAVYHIFEDRVLLTFDFDDETYAVYSFDNDDPEWICSRVEKRDIRTVTNKNSYHKSKKSSLLERGLLAFNKITYSVLKYFGLEPSGDIYAVLNPKYEYIDSVQGFSSHWSSLKNSLGEKAAVSLMEMYILSLDDTELFKFFFDGFKLISSMRSWDAVENDLKNSDVDDPRVFDLLRESQALFADLSLIHNRHESHFAELKRMSDEYS